MSATSGQAGPERIRVERQLCVGAGQCALAAPAVFDQSVDDGMVLVLDETPRAADLPAVREAVWACPTGAVTRRADAAG